MSDNPTEAPVQPAVATPESTETKGTGNVGVNEAVSRMLKMEQSQMEANTKADNAAPLETAPIEPSAADAAQAPSAEEPKVEEPANPETETEGSEDVPSHDEQVIDPKLQEKINKRIGKEVAKRKALEAQLNELTLKVQAQAQTPPPPVPVVPLPNGAPPLANIEDVSGLIALQQQAKEAKRWAEEQLDSDAGQVQLGDKVLGAKDLKAIIRNANKTLEDDIPQRAQFLTARNQAQQAAFEQFPFLKDKSSPDYVAAQSAYQAMPWLRNLPNSDWIVGVQIEGLKALKAKQEAATKVKAKAVTPKAPSAQTAVSASGSTARVAVGTKAQQDISAIRQSQSRKGGVTANEAIAALTKIEQLKYR